MKIIFLWIFSCLPFFQFDFPLDRVPKTFELIEYSGGIDINNNKTINTSNEFMNFFKKNDKGWKCSYVTYVPNKLLFSKKMQINIMKGMVVVNYEYEDGKYSQITKDLNTEELIEIINKQEK